MKKSLLMFSCCIGLLLTACNTTTNLYSWHNYEKSAYQYQKKNTDETFEKAMKEYLKVIENQNGTRKAVPPGLNAEYGYMLYKAGKKSEGINYFKQEILLYPESEVYISRIIKQLEQ